MAYDEFEDDDPMELTGMVLPGEPGQLEAMAECFVEEYVRMGWDEQRLMTLFRQPLFLATHRIYRQKGEGYVRELIARVSAKWKVISSCKPQTSKPETSGSCPLKSEL
jgi:hypothetical protein